MVELWLNFWSATYLIPNLDIILEMKLLLIIAFLLCVTQTLLRFTYGLLVLQLKEIRRN